MRHQPESVVLEQNSLGDEEVKHSDNNVFPIGENNTAKAKNVKLYLEYKKGHIDMLEHYLKEVGDTNPMYINKYKNNDMDSKADDFFVDAGDEGDIELARVPCILPKLLTLDVPKDRR